MLPRTYRKDVGTDKGWRLVERHILVGVLQESGCVDNCLDPLVCPCSAAQGYSWGCLQAEGPKYKQSKGAMEWLSNALTARSGFNILLLRKMRETTTRRALDVVVSRIALCDIKRGAF